METTDLSYRGKYSGEIVRDDAVAFIRNQSSTTQAKPWFLYVAFQEAHSPYQVDAKYRALYPQLQKYPQSQNLAGMITHTDEMIGDIIDALNETRQLPNTAA